MKRLFRASLLVAATLFASCSGNKQSSFQVSISTFGPNPIERGEWLTIKGSNLDKAEFVEFKGADPVAEIIVEQGGELSIVRVQTPLFNSESGVFTITTKGGRTATSPSELTFYETVVLNSFEAPQTCYPGDVVTLKGKYMNLVTDVVFGDEELGYKASPEEGASFFEARVILPVNAVNGPLTLMHKGTNDPVVSAQSITMGIPTVDGLGNVSARPGDKITITGTHLEMVAFVTFEPAQPESEADVAEAIDSNFTLSEDSKTITTTVPSNAISGDFKIVSYQGTPFIAGRLVLD